jgi:hypothetical protein
VTSVLTLAGAVASMMGVSVGVAHADPPVPVTFATHADYPSDGTTPDVSAEVHGSRTACAPSAVHVAPALAETWNTAPPLAAATCRTSTAARISRSGR